MKHKRIIIASVAGLVSLSAIAGLTASTYAASATSTNVSSIISRHQGKIVPEFRRASSTPEKAAAIAKIQEARTAIKAAIEANNYEAWLQAVGSTSPIAQKINQDNFAKYVEAQNLIGQAQKIMTDLGVAEKMGLAKGMRHRSILMPRSKQLTK